MAAYVIPTIQSLPLLQQQLNAMLGNVSGIFDVLTAPYVADESSVPLLTETGAALEMDP